MFPTGIWIDTVSVSAVMMLTVGKNMFQIIQF